MLETHLFVACTWQFQLNWWIKFIWIFLERTDLGYFKYCWGNKNDSPGACCKKLYIEICCMLNFYPQVCSYLYHQILGAKDTIPNIWSVKILRKISQLYSFIWFTWDKLFIITGSHIYLQQLQLCNRIQWRCKANRNSIWVLILNTLKECLQTTLEKRGRFSIIITSSSINHVN